MNHLEKSQNDTNSITHGALARPATWDDEVPLDHHIEEMLGAFAQLGLQAPRDGSA